MHPILRRLYQPLLAACLVGAPAAAPAQLVSPKTVPVATGDQFLIYPSLRLGMGGVTVAIDDPLLDPFVNPAYGARVGTPQLFGAPTYYGVSDDNGDGITLPVGALIGGRDWFGGVAVAVQQLEGSDREWGGARPAFDVWIPQPELLSERSANNLYAFGSLGRRLGDGRTAVGFSASYAGLDAVDGVDLLYAMSQSIEQDGHMADFRLGALRELEGDASVEALLLHNRFDMTHDVTYLDWRWQRNGVPTVTQRVERNLDATNTWGVHLGYQRPVGSAGWRAGGVLTGNYKDHPKIPNYEIMNIPRDPGHSWAYNLGVGLAKTEGPATVAVDAIYEPIWSHTWAAAAEPVTTASGGTIPVGERTVENDFVFSNAILRMGLGREEERYGFQLGLQVRAIHYELDQDDRVRGIHRQQEESWAEWTPTWGVGLRFPEVEVRYAGRLTTGTGRPGVAWTGARMDAAALASTFLPAPTGPLTLQEARVLTHQVMVTLPMGPAPGRRD